MILGMVSSFLTGGISVAIVNQGLQYYREKRQRLAENNSFILKEKLKILNKLELEFKDYEYTTGIIYLEIKKYMQSSVADRKTELQKVKRIRDTINNTSINTPNYMGNLNVHLNYFPNFKIFVDESKLHKYQGDIVKACWNEENKKEKYYTKRLKGIKDKQIEEKFFDDMEKFKHIMTLIKKALGKELIDTLEGLRK